LKTGSRATRGQFCQCFVWTSSTQSPPCSRLDGAFVAICQVVRAMLPRGRLDISAGQLWWALFACLRNHSSESLAHSVQSRWSGWHVLPVLSVRTAWDAFLAEQQWSAGDEILMSAVTISDMVQIVREHRLVPVPVPVDFDSLAVLPDELARRITSRARAAIVAHLFGCRMAIAPLAAVTRRAGIFLIEDAPSRSRASSPSQHRQATWSC
jgi:perosamine synthetase